MEEQGPGKWTKKKSGHELLEFAFESRSFGGSVSTRNIVDLHIVTGHDDVRRGSFVEAISVQSAQNASCRDDNDIFVGPEITLIHRTTGFQI